MVNYLSYTQFPNLGPLSGIWRYKEHPCPFSPNLKLWGMPDVPAWYLSFGHWFGYGQYSLVHPCSEFWLSILILKMQRTSMSIKSSSGAWKMLEVTDWDLALDFDLDMVTGLWYTLDPNFGSLSWFWRCKEHPCPLSPHLGLCRMLEVPDWGLASWSWFGYVHWSFIHPWSKFWLSILNLKMLRAPTFP